MTLSLTIRNLTSTRVILRAIETFEDPESKQSRAGGFSFSSNASTVVPPSASEIERRAQSFSHEHTDIELSAFESYTLETAEGNLRNGQASSSDLSTTSLRLTFEIAGGERYRVDANPAYTQKSSHPLVALSPNPSTSFTALFHPAAPIPHLTIHSNHLHDLTDWMSQLSSNLPLSALSLPGSHNSHTHYRALPSVRCQLVPIKSQLEHGIRFLDIRLQPVYPSNPDKQDVYLVHGAFPISLTGPKYLHPILKTCYEFLDQHPSETILISLKREGVGSSTDEHLSQILEKHYISPNAQRWYTDDRLPYLSEVRGKLVLVRRYDLPMHKERPRHIYGLDATSWPYNSTHATHGTFCVQDFCEVLVPTQIPEKLQYSNDHLVRSAACTAFIPGINTDKVNPIPPGPLYLNFLSGSNFWNMGCWPGNIAKVVNRGIEEWICMGHHLEEPLVSTGRPGTSDGGKAKSGLRRAKIGDGGTGVVVMDNVGENDDWDLVRLIIGMNMGVMSKI